MDLAKAMGKQNENTFIYDKIYFDNHYKSNFYRWYIESVRNRAIKKIIYRNLKEGRILEIGFGNDNLLKLFLKDFEIYGVDISDFAVNEMRMKYGPDNFTYCDIAKEKIPFEHQFDAICALNVVEHLCNPGYAFENIHSSLKDGGLFILQMPLKGNIFSRIQYKIFYDVPEHLYQPSFDSLNEALNQAGFKLVEKCVSTFFPLKISASFIINSFNLFLGVYKKAEGEFFSSQN
ncbi:MAG: class I SAM-dependent methyltransferase [candidate division WOR-3 bacterium]|nr:class I SAM-dependent methyltransferase [candidate division WOR-3 bacterium]